VRLKEIVFHRYGPLPPIRWELPEGIQVIYGANESGKTLLLDALIKRLTGGKGWTNGGLHRVNEDPEGYIIFEHKKAELKVDARHSLADHLNTDPADLRNIFVVRDGDLRIDSEAKVYEDLTDRLSGIRTNDIRSIQSRLMDLGSLTPKTFNLSNKAPERVKTQLRNAKKLREKVSEYLERAETEGLVQVEARLYDARVEENRLGGQKEALEKAREKAELGRLREILQKAGENHQRLRHLPSEESLTELQTEFRRSKERLGGRPRVEQGAELFKKIILILSPFMGVVGVIAALVRDLVSFSIFVLTLVAWTVALGLWLRDARRVEHVERVRQDLLRKAGRIGLQGETTADLFQALEGAIAERKAVTEALYERLGVLRDRFGLDKEDPDEVLERASRAVQERETTVDPKAPSDFDEEAYKKVQGDLSAVLEEIATLSEQLEEHREFLRVVSGDLVELNFERSLGEPLDLVVRNFDSLRLLEGILEEFINSVEGRAEECRQAIAIWQEIKREEEQTVAELFGPDSEASKILGEITEGRYDAVEYDHTARQLMLCRPDGTKLPATSVSRGTLDQLYFAIRMALGRKLLEGEPGFFLLDEAFLSSDERRLRCQMRFLDKLASSGWQVIYLTAKNEIKEAVGDAWKERIITMESLP
jgi:hypothetical protein